MLDESAPYMVIPYIGFGEKLRKEWYMENTQKGAGFEVKNEYTRG